MEKELRIAFCVSGQPRTWRKCYRSWFDAMGHLGEIDVFAHLWDYNSMPSIIQGIPDQRAYDLPVFEKILKPKKMVVDSEKDVFGVMPMHPSVQFRIFPPALHQFYGIRKCAYLKRQYEIENNFEYDIVVRIRTDIYFREPLGNLHALPNTMHTSVNAFDEQYKDFRIGDIFYYSNSHAYDQSSRFFDAFSYIDERTPLNGQQNYPPEMAFYFYLKSIGLQNNSVLIDAKIMRNRSILAHATLAPYEIV
jgi:hypothetical protein